MRPGLDATEAHESSPVWPLHQSATQLELATYFASNQMAQEAHANVKIMLAEVWHDLQCCSRGPVCSPPLMSVHCSRATRTTSCCMGCPGCWPSTCGGNDAAVVRRRGPCACTSARSTLTPVLHHCLPGSAARLLSQAEAALKLCHDLAPCEPVPLLFWAKVGAATRLFPTIRHNRGTLPTGSSGKQTRKRLRGSCYATRS